MEQLRLSTREFVELGGTEKQKASVIRRIILYHKSQIKLS